MSLSGLSAMVTMTAETTVMNKAVVGLGAAKLMPCKKKPESPIFALMLFASNASMRMLVAECHSNGCFSFAKTWEVINNT